jgi:prevent-host-death family protein
MEVVSVFEAKNKLSGLIANVEKNDISYLICRNGKPVAEIVAHKSKNRLKSSPKLRVDVKGDLFDDDMSEDFECLQ